MSAYINKQAAEKAGAEVARKFFQAGGYHGEVNLIEEELASLCKIAFEMGVQRGIKALEAALRISNEGNDCMYDLKDLEDLELNLEEP